jgi:4-amino-4-deoxychorismate lyase
VAKIILTRGAGGRGYAAPTSLLPTRVVAAFPCPPESQQRARDGVAIRRCAMTLGAQPRLAGAKTLNRLENVLARAEWDDAGIAEGLLADAEGHVIEGTMSNVFLVTHGAVATPKLDRCGVIGAQRERVRETLSREGIRCIEQDLPWQALLAADEVFLTNSVHGAWPVVAFESRRWEVGPLTRRVQGWLEAADALV